MIGVGNGDPSCHEPDVYVATAPSRARPIDGWRWKKIADAYAANLPETAEIVDDAAWTPTDVRAGIGPLGPNERGVFRTKFTISAEELAEPAVELWFGEFAGNGRVYVNGKLIGNTGESRTASVYDGKALLRPGENTIAVTLANYGAAGGLLKGVELRLQGQPQPVQWQRSAFNGLAQIIVQASKQAGPLQLTATADGLQPATAVIEAKPAQPRPAL
jgi:beta-galactosidase